jgi:hypothetical protein
MANLLVAGNSSNGGTAITTDTSGTLNIVTGSGSGSNAITIDASQNVTATGNLSFNSGYGSAAVAYGCRAWVNFNGQGTIAIRASGNVSSISDIGTGDYYVNYTTNMPDGNYSVVGTVSSSGGGIYILCTDVAAAYEVSRVRVAVANGSATVSDRSIVNVAIFR